MPFPATLDADSAADDARIARAACGVADGLWEWSIEEDELWCSPRFADLLGYAPGDLPSDWDGFSALFHPGDSEDAKRAFAACREGDGDLNEQFRLKTGRGEFQWFRARGLLFRDMRGRPARISGGIQDIHDHRTAAARLQEKERTLMQHQRMEALDCMAGGIAHEFNNVLQAICGYVAFARSELPEEGQPYKDLTRSLEAAEKAAQLTREMLNFARAEESADEPIDLNTVFEGLVELLRPVIGENIELRVRAAAAPLLSRVNVLELRQALLNLCINARDAISGVGVLSLSASPFVVTAGMAEVAGPLEPGAYCRLMVTDTGSGIHEDVLRRIFDPFFTTKEVGAGSGMGLAAVYGFAQRSGGWVTAYSEGVGHGSTFALYLPLREPSEMHEPRGCLNQRGAAPQVLLVEDDALVRDVGRRMLESAGCRVLVAPDGESAIEEFVACAGGVDLIVLDMVLPRMDGRRVYESIRRLDRNVPVVFCTGYDPGSVQGEDLASCGGAVLCKPYDQSQLISVVEELVAMETTA